MLDLTIIDKYQQKNPDIKYIVNNNSKKNFKGFYCSVERKIEIYSNNIKDNEELEFTLKHETFHIKLLDTFFNGYQGYIILKRLLNGFYKYYPEQFFQIKEFYPKISNTGISCECLAFYSEEHISKKPNLKSKINFFLIYFLIKKNIKTKDIYDFVNYICYKNNL